MTNAIERVLVIGAAGRHAALVIPMLVARGVTVRGLIRSEGQAQLIFDRGAHEYVVGDLKDSTSIESALQGVDGVFYIAPVLPGDNAQRYGKALVEAAVNAGVQRFVFSSVIHSIITVMDNHIQKVPVEEALIKSGMEFTILRPCHFYQNMLPHWSGVVERRIFSEPFSNKSKLSHVDYRDVAEVAAIALTEERLINGTFELCADSGFCREEVVVMMSELLGYSVSAEQPDFESFIAGLPLPNDGGYTSDALKKMFTYYDKYGLVGNPLTLKMVLGREPRTMREFFRDLIEDIPVIASP